MAMLRDRAIEVMAIRKQANCPFGIRLWGVERERHAVPAAQIERPMGVGLKPIQPLEHHTR